jgi:hypothetical protein
MAVQEAAQSIINMQESSVQGMLTSIRSGIEEKLT